MYANSDTGNTKFVLDRIEQAEKYLGTMCVQFGKICRKEARLRDCNDTFVQNIFEFTGRERINTTLRESLQQYGSYLSAVEDYRNALITRIETQILDPLGKYNEILKHKRQAVQRAINARDKGAQRQRKLQETSNRNPGNRDAIISLEVNAEFAQTEASRAEKLVQDEIDQFEHMKLTDIKRYLTEFTLINLAFHARALEMYTIAHQQLLNINVDSDLEEFRTVAPFHRLHPSQRSVSETALHNPKRNTPSSLGGAYSGSMSALPDSRRDADFGSRHSLPTGGGSHGGSSDRRHPGGQAAGHTSKPDASTSRGKVTKTVVSDASSSDSSDSDD